MASTLNSDNGVVSGSSGLKSTADTSGVLALQSNGSTALSISTGLITTLTNPLPIGSGGTGATSLSGITTGTATNLAGGSNGTVPYQSAAGTTQMLAVGTSGQVLRSNGAAAPSWVTPSAGALVFINSQVVSSAVATVDFSNLFTSTYDDYVVYFGGVTSSAGSGQPLTVRLQKNGAFGTTGYNWGYLNARSSGTAQTSTAAAATQIILGPNASLFSDPIQGGFCAITNANSATGYAVSVVAQIFAHSTSAGSVGMITAGGTSSAAFVTTGIQFLTSTGNITAGNFRLYGVAKS